MLLLLWLPTSHIALAQLAPENEAIRRTKGILEHYEKLLGPEHRQTAAKLYDLAELNRKTGDFAQAKTLHERILNITEKASGPEHPATATSLNNLAALYSSMADYAKAEPLFQRALRIREKNLGSEHPHTATTLHALARGTKAWETTPRPSSIMSAL